MQLTHGVVMLARMTCDLSELLEQARTPDSEIVDLIEKAFLEGQIDGQATDLAYLCLLVKKGCFH